MLISDPFVYQFILLLGAFLAGIVQGATGFGSGLILNAFWLHILEPSIAIPLNIISCLFISGFPIYKLRKTLDFSKLKSLIYLGLIGIPIGVFILSKTEPIAFKVAVGLLLIIYSIWMFVSRGVYFKLNSNPLMDKLVGLVSGIMGGFAALGGILPTVWVGLQKLPKNTQRGTYEPFIFITSIASIISFYFAGLITLNILIDFIRAFPALIIGAWIGIKIYPKINEDLFRKAILILIFLAGLILLV